MKRRGFSLLEMVVACSLFALVAPLLFSLFPASLRAMRRSEMMQQSMLLASYRMDEANVTPHVVGMDVNTTVTLDGRDYQVTRQYFSVPLPTGGTDPQRIDMAVTVKSADMQPVQLQTRFVQGGS